MYIVSVPPHYYNVANVLEYQIVDPPHLTDEEIYTKKCIERYCNGGTINRDDCER